jgi:hypothetical protein
MAEATAIIDITIQGYAQLNAAIDSVAKLKQEQKDLDRQIAAGTITLEQYTRDRAINTRAIAEANSNVQDLRRSLQQQMAAERTATALAEDRTGSLVEMRRELGLLNRQYAQLSRTEREAATGTGLQTQIQNLDRDIRAIEQPIGQFQRNVGNYANSVFDALSTIHPAFGEIANAIQGLQGATEALTAVSEAFNLVQTANVVVTGEQIVATEGQVVTNNQATISQNALTGALFRGNAAGKAFNLTMLANPIGLVIVAIAALLVYFTQFDGALDALEQGWAGVQAALKPVVKTLGELGKAIIEFIKLAVSPLIEGFKVLSKLVTGDVDGAIQAVKDGIKNVGDQAQKTKEATESYTKSLAGMGSEMAKAYTAAADLQKQIQDLEDQESTLALNRIRREKEIAQLERNADNRNQSAQKRLASLEEAKKKQLALSTEAAAIEAKQAELKVKQTLRDAGLADSYFAKNKKYTAAEIEGLGDTLQKLSNQGKLLGDLNKHRTALAEALTTQLKAEQAINDVNLDYAAKTGKIRNAIDAERNQLLAKQTEATDKAREAQIRLLELQTQTARGDEQTMAAQKALLAAKLQDDLKAAQSDALKLELKKKYNQDLEALDFEAAQNRAKQMAEFAATVEGQELARIEEANKRKLAAILEAEANLGLSQEAADLARLEAEAEHLQQLLEYQRQFGIDTIDTENEINAARIESKKQAADQASKIQEAEFQTAKNTVNAMSSLMSILAGNSAVSADFQKMVALTQIAIDTAQSIAGIVRIASTTSPDPITYGVQLTGGIASVLANIAQATSIISGANSPAAPSFAKMARGGFVGGNLHSNGGTMAELERGEMVMTRGAVSQYAPMLNAMNVSGGGVGSAPVATSVEAAANDLRQSKAIEANEAANVSLNTRDFARVQRFNTQPRDLARL